MTHNEAQTTDLPLFQGLIENEGRSYSNWGQHRRTTPAVFAEPITYADVQSLVRDDAHFPTPVWLDDVGLVHFCERWRNHGLPAQAR